MTGPRPLAATRSESGLVDRARAGDAHALATLTERELPRVERLLGRILGHRQDLEDLVQTVFMELCRALPRYRGESQFSTFVGGITVHVARRALRPSAFSRRRGPMPAHVEAEGQDQDRSVIARDRLRRVHRALDRMAADKRIAFTLYTLEGLSPSEIAALTGANENTVRSRIFHARKELISCARRDPALRELVSEEP